MWFVKFKNALIGINDASGNLGISVPGRNTGIWAAKWSFLWVFAPSGNNLCLILLGLMEQEMWLYSKNQMVCPQKDETFKVNIVYNTYNGQSITYTDDININLPQIILQFSLTLKIVCNIADKITLADYKQFLTTNDISNFNFEFIDAATGLAVDENTFLYKCK